MASCEAPQSPWVSLSHVTKRFAGVTALADVSLDIRRGEIHAVVGENGAGKSTLMKILAGVIPDYEGQVRVAGRAVRFVDTRDAERSGVSIIHQELNLVEELSVAANLFLGRERTRRAGWLDERAMQAEATERLVELECLALPAARVGSLRVGDQQLIEIAKALALEAEILIMDEPTSALTETEVARLFRVIDRLRARGVTILYISHKMDEVFRLADRITVLRDGRLVETFDRQATDARRVTHAMVGREIESFQAARATAGGDVVLEVRSLRLAWPGHARRWRLENISMALRRGEVLGVAGLLGAGRTELLEALFGASPVSPEGEILLDGQPVRFRHPAEAREAGLALVTEDRKRLGIFDQLDVGENVGLCALGKATQVGFLRPRWARRQAQAAVERVGVKTAGLGAPITSLSGGNQQKAILARWLLTGPKVLLLDDPTRGIDVGAKAELYRLIHSLCEQGLGVIITSSELPELIALCDRILVLCEGRLRGEFARGAATEQAIMEAATMRGDY